MDIFDMEMRKKKEEDEQEKEKKALAVNNSSTYTKRAANHERRFEQDAKKMNRNPVPPVSILQKSDTASSAEGDSSSRKKTSYHSLQEFLSDDTNMEAALLIGTSPFFRNLLEATLLNPNFNPKDMDAKHIKGMADARNSEDSENYIAELLNEKALDSITGIFAPE